MKGCGRVVIGRWDLIPGLGIKAFRAREKNTGSYFLYYGYTVQNKYKDSVSDLKKPITCEQTRPSNKLLNIVG